jgi:hypothetical protein
MGRNALEKIEEAFRAGFQIGSNAVGYFGPSGAEWVDFENNEWKLFKKQLDKDK